MQISEWVKDIAKKAGYSTEETAQLEQLLSKPGAKQEIVDGFQRQSDYSRNMQELKQKISEEDAYAARLVEWETANKAALQTAQQQADAYKSQVYNMALQYNVDPQDFQRALAQTPAQPTQTAAQPAAAPDPKWVTRDQVDNYATAMFRINAKMIGLNQEHIRLFGKPMDNIETFVDEALRQGQNNIKIEDTFRNFYKVSDRETELREQDTQARIAKAIEEAKQSWITTGANPLAAAAATPKGWGSPVLEHIEREKAGELGDHAAHRTRVQEAVQAFNSAQLQSGLPTA